MKVSDTFYNIRCDSCGTELCEEWYHDVGNDEFATILGDSGWFTAEHDRHYCPDCWERDDDDRIKAGYEKLMQDVQPVFAKLYQANSGANPEANTSTDGDTEFHQ
jgi:hypothetical protein